MTNAKLSSASTPLEYLALEGDERAASFESIDRCLYEILTSALSGKRVADVDGERTEKKLLLPILQQDQVVLIRERFQREQMQSQGAWWLPDEVSIKAASMNLPGAVASGVRFPTGDSGEDSVRVPLDNPEHLFAWFTLQPLFAHLFAPLELRGTASGKKEREVREKAWLEADEFYQAVGLSLGDSYSLLRDAAAWVPRDLAQRNEAKRAFLEELTSVLTFEAVQAYRAFSLSSLVDKFYAKSKKVSATQRQVVNKALQAPLATYFGGSWLAFLDYLGEEPSVDEEITTALPGAKLFVGASDKVNKIAAEKGLDPKAVEGMLASFYGEAGGKSPVERRADVCRQYWSVFEKVHDAQVSGMPSLWGLIDDGMTFSLGDPDLPYQPRQMGSQPYQANALVRHVPTAIAEEIEELWGTEVLPRYPERIVNTTHPHAAFAKALGPALEFWHGVSLTAWFICEGPYSRTTIEGMAEYYRRHLKALDEIGTPISRDLFDDLQKAESKLGEPQNIEESFVEGGMTISIGMGSRREGFEVLRDVIALHRRQWTTNCFETYLRARWEGDLKQASWELNRHIAAKGKQPTAKQFLGFGADTTNRWFGGDLGDAYAAMGEKSPVAQQRVDLMPSNRFGFAQLVFERMGGKATTQQERFRTERASQLEERLGDIPVALQMGPIQPDRGNWTLQRLADQAPKYVQLTEALDRPPTAKELGVERWLEERDGLGTLWPQYVSVIEAVLDEARALAPWRRAESVPANPQPPPTSPIQAAPISSPSSFVTGASATSKKSLLKRLFGR